MIKPILSIRPTVVLTIIKLNILVFFLWWLSPLINQEFMIDNFLVSWTGLMHGRVWVLITSVFSHNMFFHIFINMYAFLGFGTVVESVLGPERFLRFYLLAGITASFCHAIVSAYLLREPSLPALGASGAISGVIILFSLMYPEERILLFGIIPIPALFASLLFVGLDVWGLIAQTHGSTLPIGHGAHLGGALFGGLYYILVVKGRNPFRYNY